MHGVRFFLLCFMMLILFDVPYSNSVPLDICYLSHIVRKIVLYCVHCCYFRQFIPLTCTCTQYALRVKALEGDMTKYSCFQGYFNCCCFRAGSCGEQSCPELCLCFESCCCNSLAVSATRAMVTSASPYLSDSTPI